MARVGADTNVALAELHGVCESAVRNWLSGASPPADVLVLLHEKLGFNPTYLLTGEGDPFARVSESSEEGRQRLAATVNHLRASMDELASACRQVLPLLDASVQADLATSLKELSKSLDEFEA